MNKLVCPHCKAHRIATARVPKDVVVVMPCPGCGELNVLYRNHAIALDRHVLENGTFDERKSHLAHVIAEFLETGIFSASFEIIPGAGREEGEEEPPPFDLRRRKPRRILRRRRNGKPITDEEFQAFKSHGLKQIDDPETFKKLFG